MAVGTRESNPVNYQARALERGLRILAGFSARQPEMTLMEIARAQGLNKSTAFRLLACLAAEGFVQRDSETGKYSLAVKLFELGGLYLRQLRLEDVARPHLERLASTFDLSANLAILDRGEVVYLAIVGPAASLRYYGHAGVRNRAHCSGLGKCILAYLPEEELLEVVRTQGLPQRGPKTATTLQVLKERLEFVCTHGYALDDEEGGVGSRCVAAPVRDFSGKVVAALSLAGSIFTITDDRLPDLIDAVVGAATEVSHRMGYTG